MPPTNDRPHDPTPVAGLARTRKAVLDVLVADALAIAASGWLIRSRAGGEIPRPSRWLHDGLFGALLLVAVASYVIRRSAIRTDRSLSPERRAARSFRSRVGAAAVAALALPIGLAYGWFVEPTLQGVAPFWVAAVALGILAFPMRGELEG